MRSFIHNDQFYKHWLNTINDSVCLYKCDGNERKTILIYTADCKVLDAETKKQIGHFSVNDELWEFHSDISDFTLTSNKNIYKDVEGLLDFEVEVSKWYLDYLAAQTQE